MRHAHAVRSSTLVLLSGLGVFLAVLRPAQAAVNISNRPTKHMHCSDGVCSPTSDKAVLNTGDLTAMLQSSDIKVVTGSGAVNIEIISPLTWTSAHRLTLDAYDDVAFKAPVTVAGTGAVAIVTNDGGFGGDLKFARGGKLDFWDLASPLAINNIQYTLVGDVATLADLTNHDNRGYFALATDYDASVDGVYSNSPIFYGLLQGIFEGLGHKIANLTIVSQDCCGNPIGFFSEIGDNVFVRDFALENVNISPASQVPASHIGGVAGKNAGVIKASFVSGTIDGGTNLGSGFQYGYVGGLVAYSTGLIVDSHTDTIVTVEGGTNPSAGGLVGTQSGVIIGSSSASNVTASTRAAAGGLVATNYGSIAFSHATGAISAGDGGSASGGLVGSNAGSIERSFATGPATSGSNTANDRCGSWAGGLVGLSQGANTMVRDSYATGAATAGTAGCVGGLVGEFSSNRQQFSTIATSYAVGAVAADFSVGGLIGRGEIEKNDESITAGYWDTDTTGAKRGMGNAPRYPGISGLTDAQLKSGLPAGFDPAIWGQDPSINSGYPYLLANPPE